MTVAFITGAAVLCASCGSEPATDIPEETRIIVPSGAGTSAKPSDTAAPAESSTESAAAESATVAPFQTQTVAPPQTVTPPQTEKPIESQTKPQTEKPTESQTKPQTTEPVEPKPVPTPEYNVVVADINATAQTAASSVFCSTVSDYIKLYTYWSLGVPENGQSLLTLTVKLGCHGIGSVEKEDMGHIKAGNLSLVYSTPYLNYPDSDMEEIQIDFATRKFYVSTELTNLSIGADWTLMGSYHGIDIEVLENQATLNVKQLLGQ